MSLQQKPTLIVGREPDAIRIMSATLWRRFGPYAIRFAGDQARSAGSIQSVAQWTAIEAQLQSRAC
jgi:hypothetical protein